MNRPLLSRYAPLAVALIAIVAAFAYAFHEETPLGRVEGTVVIQKSGAELGDVEVSLVSMDDDSLPTRRAVTGTDGSFSLSRVPAGRYYATAYTRAHRVDNVELTVEEGKTAATQLALVRSQPDLQVAQHQRVFAIREKAVLPVRGYIDGEKPRNGDRVHVRVFRTRLSRVLSQPNLATALDGVGNPYTDTPTGLPAVFFNTPGFTPEPVLERDLPIVEADREGFFHKRIPIETGGPGLYLVDVQHGPRTVSAWVVATDTALVVKKAATQLVTYTVDMSTGQPIGGGEIRCYRDGRMVRQGRSDARGVAELSLPSQPGDSRLVTVAIRGNDEAVLGRNDYQYEERGAYTVFTYTDRPIYRPGQRIQFKGIARRKDAGGARRYSVPSGQRVKIEVRDPAGERILNVERSTNNYGSFNGEIDLSPEAPTGTYSLVAEIGGEQHTTDIVVAAYRKPEFAVSVTPEKKRYIRGQEMAVTIDAQYYFGSPVSGGKVKYYVFREADWAAGYPDDYGFDPEEESGRLEYGSYYGETADEGEATLDENGRAVVRIRADVPDDPEAPQEHLYTLYATVTDAAQREVEGQGVVRVTPGDFRLTVSPEGYVAEPGKPTAVLVRARDFDGNPIAGRSVSIETAYATWDDEARSSRLKVEGRQSATTGPDGQAVVTVTPPREGDLRIQASARDAANRTVRASAYLWVAGDQGRDISAEYPDLSLLTDKRNYAPGETARVLLNTSQTGQTALVTIEGERVYKTIAVPITRRSTVLRLPILESYGPNVLLAACYVRGKRFASSEAPLRVSLPDSEVKVEVTADRTRYEPGDPISYAVRTTDLKGRPIPCEFSLGVVDESIYALREDDPKAIRDAFYPRRYNMVSTSHSFAVEYLGNADKSEPDIEARKRFPDTAYWAPSLRTDASGRATVSLTLPDNLTTWRATVIAQTQDTAVGREASKVISTKDFFVRLEKPRFLTEGDRSQLTALVHNETGAEQTALVRIQTEGLTATGDLTRTMTVRPGQVATVTWPVTAARSGEAKIRLTAWTPKSAGATQYTDGIETTLPVRVHGRDRFDSASGSLGGNVTLRTESLTLDPKATPNSARLVVRITPSVPDSLVGALDYLVGYPYGCVEQTMSRFLPDLLVQRLNRAHPDVAKTDRAAEIPKMVRDGLTRLYRFQHDGGWGWWQYDEPDPFMTAYVLYGLGTARSLGYDVSEEVIRGGREAADKLLQKPIADRRDPTDRNVDGNDKAFLALALARLGSDVAAATALRKLSTGDLDSDGLAYAALAAQEAGIDGEAYRAALYKRAVREGGFLHWSSGTRRWDSNDRMATALGLRVLLADDPGDPRVVEALRWLMAARTDDYWGSTRDTAWVVDALCDYLAVRPADAARPSGNVAVRVNGTLVETVALAGSPNGEREMVIRVPAKVLRPDANTVALARSGGESSVFYSVSLRQTIAMDPLPAVSTEGIRVEREILRVLPRKVGQDAWTLKTEATNGQLKQGDRVRVRLTIHSDRPLAYVLIEDPFPSGCEVTERGSEYDVVDWDYWYSSVDVRDDRVAFFARTLGSGKHTVEYNLRAQTPGEYRTLPTMLQCMYVPEIRAESTETRVVVR